MGLIQRRGLGSQPTVSTSASRRGGGGVTRSRGGGGGGGGGGGRNRIPNTGLYHGRAGEGAANQNPEQFFRNVVSRLGGLGFSGTPVSEFSQGYSAELLNSYLGAQAGKQRLSPIDWLKQQYGAGFFGNKGRDFQAGSLGDAASDGAFNEAYTDHYSNTRGDEFLAGEMTNAGGYVPGGGNAEYKKFLGAEFNPMLTAELAAARVATPEMSLADLIEGRDLTTEARARFLARPGAQRQLSPANLAGRWSWWE